MGRKTIPKLHLLRNQPHWLILWATSKMSQIHQKIGKIFGTHLKSLVCGPTMTQKVRDESIRMFMRLTDTSMTYWAGKITFANENHHCQSEKNMCQKYWWHKHLPNRIKTCIVFTSQGIHPNVTLHTRLESRNYFRWWCYRASHEQSFSVSFQRKRWHFYHPHCGEKE